MAGYLLLAGSFLLLITMSKSEDVGQKVKLDKNLVEPLAKLEMQGGVGFSAGVEVGIQEQHLNKGLHQDMIVDIGYSDVLIPNGQTGTFGIACEAKDSCFVGLHSGTCSYGFKDKATFPCIDAKAFLRFSNSSLDNKKVVPLGFNLFQGDDNFSKKYSAKGVLGLSPSSPFWNFLISAFEKIDGEDYIAVSLYYNIEKKGLSYDISKVDYSTSHLVVNGRYTTTEQVAMKVVNNQTYWQIPNVTYSLLNQKEEKRSVCVDNSSSQVVFFSKQYEDLIKQVSQKLCGKDSGCKKDESETDKINLSYFKFKGDDGSELRIEIDGSDLVGWSSDDTAIIGIGDIKQSSACENEEIAFGNLFYTKIELSLRVKDGPQFEIGVSKNNSPTVWIYFICFGILVADLILVVLGTLAMRKFLAKYQIVNYESITESLKRDQMQSDEH